MASYQNFTFTAYVNLAQGTGYGLLSYGQLRPSHLLDAYDGSNNGCHGSR
jgi:hypothetical protein